MFKDEYYDLIEKRWVESDAITLDDDTATMTWFNPDSSTPSWEWANVSYEKVLQLRDEYGGINADNARDFCIDLASESPQWWDDFDPESEWDYSHSYDKADYIGSWDLAEAQYLIRWAEEVHARYQAA